MKVKKFFRLGLPTIIAIILAAAILLFFGTPLKYSVEKDSSDFDALPLFSCEANDGEANFELDASLFEKIDVKVKNLEEDKTVKDINQVEITSNSSMFTVCGQNIKVDGNKVYVIITGFRQAIFAGKAESFGFAFSIK